MSKLLKIIIPSAIYLWYAYVFVWQINHLNLVTVYTELQEEDKIYSKYEGAIIILLYGVLLYLNVIYNQKRLVVLNSFFAASILFMHPGIFSTIVSLLLMVFGFTIAFFDMKNK